MSGLAAWAAQPFALVHGEDGDARRAAVAAWKARHVDPEWADWSLTVCGEGCPWPEVLNALQEAPPLGASARAVVVPAADNLFAKPKELPASLTGLLEKPPVDLRLLLVAWTALPAAPGKALGAKPWTAWNKAGRILKVGALEAAEIPAFLDAEAKALGLRLEEPAKARLMDLLGGHGPQLRRALEVLELASEDKVVRLPLVESMVFRLSEQAAFAWVNALKKGTLPQALQALDRALDDEPDRAPLALQAQARREAERILELAQARERGARSQADYAQALALPPNQTWLLRDLIPVAEKLGAAGARRLLAKVNEAERDLKGLALSRSRTPLVELTVSLWRQWRA